METTLTLGFVELISQPWHWSVSGAAIALTLFLLTWMGRSFGVSMTFKDTCGLFGAEKINDFFKVDWPNETWRMVFVFGGLAGGVIAGLYLRSPEAAAISQSTISHLADWGLSYPEGDSKGLGFVPTDFFNFSSVKGIILALLGGFLVGFGARYADGCTSGHAITGLSHLQVSSLITVIGFFIGGLVMTHLLMPLMFG
ncbi:MAG: YeeE/YedE family protein [Haliscomenobacter sp.]|nr:YeeE/YedE family protein [Haliscomenobacter sp.]